MTARHLLIQKILPHAISVEIARDATQGPERDIRCKVEPLRMITRHDKQRRRVIFLHLPDELTHNLVCIPDMPQLVHRRLVRRDRRWQFRSHLVAQKAFRIDIISKRRMIARRQDEVERILRIVLHPLADAIEQDTIRRAPRRALALLRQFIRTMELIKALAQREMLDVLPAAQATVPEHRLIAHLLHHRANAESVRPAMQPHRVIDVKTDIRQARQETIERRHRTIAIGQEMIRMRSVRLQPFACLGQTERAVLWQQWPKRIVLPENHNDMTRPSRKRCCHRAARECLFNQIRIWVAAKPRDCRIPLFFRDGANRLLRCSLMCAIGALERLSIIKDGLIEHNILRTSRTLPRHTAVRMERPAKAAEDGKHRHEDNCQASPDADMALRLPDRRPQDFLQQPDEQHHQEDSLQEARPELILLHRRIPDGPFIILHAVEQHDVISLMEDLIIGNADDKEQRHQAHGHTAQYRPDTPRRPSAPYCVGNRAKDKRERHEERRRLQADTSPQPESCCNIFRTGFAKLTRIDQQEGNAKDHEQDVDVQEQLRILLQ